MKILNLAKKSVPDSAGESGTIVDPKLLKQVRTTQWKRLINQISTLQSQRSFRSLCITSPRSGEGKTLTSNMIALGYVQQLNKRVLLVNASLQPTRGTIFIERIVNKNPERADAGGAILDLVSTAATEQDDDTTKSNDFQLGDYIKQVSHAYDLIIVDSNAATEVEAHHIDPVVLAAYCDATLIVCTQQSFSKEVLEDLKATFQAQNLTGKVIGLLHNAGAQ